MLNLCGRWCRRRPNAAPGTAEAGEVEMDMVVRFDDQIKGKHVKLGSEGDTVSGTGTVACGVPLSQTRSYFEMQILSSGTVHVGVTSNIITELDLPLSSRSSSWFKNISNIAIDEIIGISYDLSSVRPLLRIFVKGKEVCTQSR